MQKLKLYDSQVDTDFLKWNKNIHICCFKTYGNMCYPEKIQNIERYEFHKSTKIFLYFFHKFIFKWYS